jgi:hypothetical protein
MTLFDDISRSETRPKRETESSFEYLNTSARAPVAAARDLLDGWFRDFPESGKADLKARFRSRSDSQHHAAFFELYVHELLRRCGFEVEVHPDTEAEEETHPDFLVSLGGKPQFYVEATLAQESAADSAAQARIDRVYETLSTLDSPNFFVGIRLYGAPATAPPGARLRSKLEAWLADLDLEEVIRRWRTSGAPGNLPHFDWPHDGCTFSFFPIPKSAEARGRPGVRPVAVKMPSARLVTIDRSIRSSLAAKSSRYGKLGLPLVIAVNVLDPLVDLELVMNGLMGAEGVQFSETADESTTMGYSRIPNGAWMGPRGAQNRSGSAVLVAMNLDYWSLLKETPILIHHPWAHHPLSPSMWPLPQMVPDLAASCYRDVDGKTAGEVLAVPSPWPVPNGA